jgi:hypothetical protein
MSQEEKCVRCGKALAPSAPGGLCPSCLLDGGLAAQTAAGGEPPAWFNWQPPIVDKLFQLLSTMYTDHAAAPWDRGK